MLVSLLFNNKFKMAECSAEEMNCRVPVIVILGATGSGKSKLGIEIARKFGGEIVSADSMQVYKGLDIVTNKVTEEERRLAQHHLLDIVETPQRFTVLDFRNRALPIIENLLKIGKLPIIVGGTNYYIESLLWRVLLEDITGEMKQEKNYSIVPCASHIDKIKEDSASEHESSVDFISGDKGSDTSIQKMNPEVKSDQDINPNILKEVGSLVSECKNDFCDCVGEKAASSNFTESKNVTYCEDEVYIQSGKSDEESNVNEIAISYDKNVGNSVKCDELVYEKDKKRLRETPVDSVERKKIKLEDEEVDVMDEEAMENISSQKLYEKLKSVDPDKANQLHPNNKRKIIRSLQVYVQMGRKHSEILQEQRSAEGGSELGGPLRYPHSCILWLQCDQEVLDRRLDSRVDIMLEQGLVQELLDFHCRYNKQRLAENIEPDYTKGIFQSIGFKEFHEYLVLSPDDRKTEEGSKLFKLGVDALKLVTRRYARRQIRWITNRFLRRPTRQVPPVYGLNTTDPSLWNEHVLNPAVEIVESMLNGEEPTQVKPLPIIEREIKNEMKTLYCDVCDRIFVGDIQWNDHLNSRKHHKMLKHKNMLDKS